MRRLTAMQLITVSVAVLREKQLVARVHLRQLILVTVAVKMSLHQPGDVVRMMDKGMAVQPGLRTLVELHYTQVLTPHIHVT